MPDLSTPPSRAPGRQRVTIADVAKHAGVSAGAVSFALNGRPGVAGDTRQRILSVAHELGWQPSHRARALSQSTSRTLGLIVARPVDAVGGDPFFAALLAGLNATLTPANWSLVFTVVGDLDEELATYRRVAAEQRVDGVLLTDLRVADPRPTLVADLGLPAVTLGRPDETGYHGSVGSVSVDDTAGIRALVASLVEQGHRHIAHVTGPESYLHVRNRRMAWTGALVEAGLRPGRCLHTDFSPGAGARATSTLLRARRAPSAIVYANDVMAIAGLAVLQRHGLDVPRDVSVTGFDDSELAQYVNPALTTVRTDVFGWGSQAATALLAAAGGASPQHLELAPSSVVARASVSVASTATTSKTSAPLRC